MSDSRLAALTINDSSIAAISSSTRTGTKMDGCFVPCRPSKHIVSWLIEHIDSEHGIEHEAYIELVEFRLVGKLRWYSHLLYVGVLTMRLTHGITFLPKSIIFSIFQACLFSMLNWREYEPQNLDNRRGLTSDASNFAQRIEFSTAIKSYLYTSNVTPS
jgi:hypothetical protein